MKESINSNSYLLQSFGNVLIALLITNWLKEVHLNSSRLHLKTQWGENLPDSLFICEVLLQVKNLNTVQLTPFFLGYTMFSITYKQFM